MAIANLSVDLSGRVVLVTGAAGRVGRGLVQAFAGSGAALVLNDVRDADLDRVVDGAREVGAPVARVAGDVGLASTADALVAAALDSFGHVDVLVNNAGRLRPVGDFLEFSEEEIDAFLRTNVRGTLLCSQRVVRQMKGQGRGGSIVNLTSVGGSQRAQHDHVVYDVTKGGIDALTRALATDYGPLGIRVNAVGPSAVNDLPPEGRGQDHPLRRGGTPADVAAAVLFLASDAARFITGQILYVDGGVSAQLRSPGVYTSSTSAVTPDLLPQGA